MGHFNSITRENNINAIRYYLAICILMSHFCVLSGYDVVQLPRIFGGAGSFFAISGFLMFPSFSKNKDVKRYLKRRARRIFPSYFFIVIVAALLCVFISNLSITEYFTSSGLWKYLAANLSFMNFVYPTLPGVFTSATNIEPAVNGSLWTMKGEVACYITVPIIFLIVNKRKITMSSLLVWLMVIFGLSYLIFRWKYINDSPKYDVPSRQCLVMFLFYMGGYLNFYLDEVKRNWKIIIGVCSIFLLLDYVNKYWYILDIPEIINIVLWNIILPIVSGLMVIVCSVTGKWGKMLANHDAITYEIYLFHFPIIQTLIYWNFIERYGFYTTLLISIIITVIFSYSVWKFISNKFTHNTIVKS